MEARGELFNKAFRYQGHQRPSEECQEWVSSPKPLPPLHRTSRSLTRVCVLRWIRASYQWTGNGLLRFFHSKWQVIGYGPYDLTDASRSKFDWLVTYFEKTPATPAGIDLYVRDPRDMPEATTREILQQMKALKSKYDSDPDPKRKQLAESCPSWRRNSLISHTMCRRKACNDTLLSMMMPCSRLVGWVCVCVLSSGFVEVDTNTVRVPPPIAD